MGPVGPDPPTPTVNVQVHILLTQWHDALVHLAVVIGVGVDVLEELAVVWAVGQCPLRMMSGRQVKSQSPLR